MNGRAMAQAIHIVSAQFACDLRQLDFRQLDHRAEPYDLTRDMVIMIMPLAEDMPAQPRRGAPMVTRDPVPFAHVTGQFSPTTREPKGRPAVSY